MSQSQREFRENKTTRHSRDTKFRHQKKRLEKHFINGLANGADELSGLCDRMYGDIDKLWMFSKFTGVDPTNHFAEKDLERIALWRKKSYETRSD